MQTNSNYTVVNIRQYLNSDNPIFGEDRLKKSPFRVFMSIESGC